MKDRWAFGLFPCADRLLAQLRSLESNLIYDSLLIVNKRYDPYDKDIATEICRAAPLISGNNTHNVRAAERGT